MYKFARKYIPCSTISGMEQWECKFRNVRWLLDSFDFARFHLSSVAIVRFSKTRHDYNLLINSLYEALY